MQFSGKFLKNTKSTILGPFLTKYEQKSVLCKIMLYQLFDKMNECNFLKIQKKSNQLLLR